MTKHSAEIAGLGPTDTFVRRHIGPRQSEIRAMLERVGCAELDELTSEVIPKDIQLGEPLGLGPSRGERDLLEELKRMARNNEVFRSYIGLGYHD